MEGWDYSIGHCYAEHEQLHPHTEGFEYFHFEYFNVPKILGNEIPGLHPGY
jgi:hypothetical protein